MFTDCLVDGHLVAAVFWALLTDTAFQPGVLFLNVNPEPFFP